MSDLANRRCEACDGSTPSLTPGQIAKYLPQVPQWQQRENAIERTFAFKGYCRTMAFVNAVAWIAHRENHHPDMHVSYQHCTVRYTTHAIDGLSENDFICAAKVDALLDDDGR